MEKVDLLIIGAGPAGLTAGIYGVRSGLNTLVVEEKLAGGTAADAPIIENYPGLGRISGAELMQKIVEHCRMLKVPIKEFEKAVSLNLMGVEKIIKTDKAVYSAKALIIASGTSYRELGVPGEKEFKGRGVSHCAVCDGPLFRGKRVLVVGGGNSAVATALYLAELASEVKIVHRRDAFRAQESLINDLMAKGNVEVYFNTQLKEIRGETLVDKVVLLNLKDGEAWEMPVDGVFVQVGETPNSQLAKEAGVEVDENGYIKVDIRQRTSIPGVFAAGDVTNYPAKQVGAAVGQAVTAALEAYGYIRRPYYYA
ncbi:MAG: FAD-dependent oxidoreductase [Candidatus Bathyarchaeota archaeon]|nr:FAD-dependent oxidoreductase [Candidatus Bathyarchaeota archaeon]MCX8177607.1 FAD-dependent oxidoreductase [Candidatus Bathyarchaeota archaeon]MDW8193864.1 FAD-dependent oxidoreductase [Nitrososphaerota archaeon]